MDESVSFVKQNFLNAFGESPSVVSRAPGRVEVLGNHTDYNEGYVLSFAVDKGVWAACGGSTTEQIKLLSSHYGDSPITLHETVPQKENPWTNYPLGVYAVLRDNGFPVRPFNMAVYGNVPLGAGLSSSAALEVACGIALTTLFDFQVEPAELAKHCQRAEHTFAGTHCGLLDQFSSIFGKKDHVLFIDFRSLDHQTIPLPSHNLCVAVTTSGISHSLVESAYNERREECARAATFFSRSDPSVRTLRDISPERLMSAKGALDDTAYRRALHIVGENERVLNGIQLLRQGDLVQFGKLLHQSHESSRVNFENSCPELDTLVDIAGMIEGVYGSRLTGGGFGGATLSLLDWESREEFEAKIREKYTAKTGAEANVYFASVDDGARVVEP
ncbi:MAG: galactokinase [Chitinivibrionales bacterium]|nr:galactokinase [Chitinivibrionales bacterium]MBD3355955.1 galactokinase [Chitinivibrionales bacterium]